MQQAIHPVVGGNLQAIAQLEELLEALSKQQYCYQDSGVTHSSIGAHTRHILDIYQALICGIEKFDLVDYDLRRRGAPIETDPEVALGELSSLKVWLQGLSEAQLAQSLSVKSEVSLCDQTSVEVVSSALRELIFASSHFVHHLAIIAILAKSQRLQTPSALGVAPATASFLRSESSMAE
ncbi:DinB family protein [Alteromonadaceae bacterium 2753L.S.0a.02]|nr:DinB family protein [Alteromonadaceae bacterium 2753L.S.0a.02]